jgi:hypothetical protein
MNHLKDQSMARKFDDLPPDLLALGLDYIDQKTGTTYTMVFPILGYCNLHKNKAYYQNCLTQDNLELEKIQTKISEFKHDAHSQKNDSVNAELEADLETIQSIISHTKFQLKIIETEIVTTKKNITNSISFEGPEGRGSKTKLKILRMLKLIENEGPDRLKRSRALMAVYACLNFQAKHNRMPSHKELKELGFSAQQATHAGQWLDLNKPQTLTSTTDENDSTDFSFYEPLHKPKRGRPEKR